MEGDDISKMTEQEALNPPSPMETRFNNKSRNQLRGSCITSRPEQSCIEASTKICSTHSPEPLPLTNHCAVGRKCQISGFSLRSEREDWNTHLMFRPLRGLPEELVLVLPESRHWQVKGTTLEVTKNKGNGLN